MRKVAVWSNSSISSTGFGVHARILIQWLITHGYEVIELAAGIQENEPILSVLPWKAFGLTPNNQQWINQVNAQGAGPLVGYGRLLVESIIKREKPDVIIAIEDSWAWTGLLDRPVYKEQKNNWIFWSPLDSTPPLKDQIDFFKSVKNCAVKATFAKKELKKFGIESHFWPALVDSKSMGLNREAGLKLRRKSGIGDNTLLFGFVFRNQLRKLVIPQIQALKLFKDKYPDKKVKLVFHTQPIEQEGWNCPRHAELEGLSEDDIYYTRICPLCNDVTIGPALKEKTICHCKRGELHHPRPGGGVSEEMMSIIYNSFDAYTHTANSGGNEMPMNEALLCGVPTACPNYSYGEMFVESGYVHPLPFTLYNEVKTGYNKAHCSKEGIVEFWEKVISLDSDEKLKLQNNQINWIRDFINIDKICSKVAKVIDECPEPNYNWEFPNENGLKPECESNEQFADEILYNFFGEIIPQAREEIINGLNSGQMSREFVFNQSKKNVIDLKNPINYKSLFKDDGKKRLLICLEKSLGDVLIFSTVLEELKKKYEGWGIYFLINQLSKQMIEHVEGVNFIISDKIPPEIIENTHFWEGSANYEKLVDIYLQPYQMTQRMYGWQHNGETILK